MVGVRQEADGIDLDDLDEVYDRLTREGRRVRLLYVVPNFQNPTGLLIGLEKRQRLLEWASRRNVLILEDDPYRELYFEDSATEADVRPIRADDSEGRVIYLSSFSKTLAPGFRVAWVDAPAPIAAKLEFAKQAEDLCTGGVDQRDRLGSVPAGHPRSPAADAARALPAQARRDGRGSDASSSAGT